MEGMLDSFAGLGRVTPYLPADAPLLASLEQLFRTYLQDSARQTFALPTDTVFFGATEVEIQALRVKPSRFDLVLLVPVLGYLVLLYVALVVRSSLGSGTIWMRGFYHSLPLFCWCVRGSRARKTRCGACRSCLCRRWPAPSAPPPLPRGSKATIPPTWFRSAQPPHSFVSAPDRCESGCDRVGATERGHARPRAPAWGARTSKLINTVPIL